MTFKSRMCHRTRRVRLRLASRKFENPDHEVIVMAKTVKRKVSVTVTHIPNRCGDNPLFDVYRYLMSEKHKADSEKVAASH